MIATAVVQLGTDIGLVRWIPTLLVRGHGHQVRPIVRIALIPVIGASVLVALLGFSFSFELAGIIDHTSDGGQLADQIKVLALFCRSRASTTRCSRARGGFRTQVPTAVTESLGRVLLQLVSVGAALVLGLGAVAVDGVVAAHTAALVVAILWFRALLRRRVPLDVASDDLTVDESGRAFGATRLLGRSGRRLRWFSSGRTSFWWQRQGRRGRRLHAAATRFVVLGQLGVQALQQALSPQLSAVRPERQLRRPGGLSGDNGLGHDPRLARLPVHRGSRPDLLKIFGPGYSEVASVVVLLSIAMLAATACGAVDTVLLMSGHTWLSLGNNLCALGLNVGLNLVLIPAYGAVGAGIS